MKKISLFLFVIFVACCTPTDDPEDLTSIPYAPTTYDLNTPMKWGTPDIPTDNLLTKDGVELGRRLFYDPILSRDSTISCGNCHKIGAAFTDSKAMSNGIENRVGSRSSMALVNLAFMRKGFFWDGRSKTLEEQALLPVEDHLEMDESWANVVKKIVRHKDYPTRFRQAFGISKKTEITKELVVKAVSQFERSIVSKDSKFDKYIDEKVELTDDEQIGYEMFENTTPTLPDAQCGHCHTSANYQFTTHQFLNNGLQEALTLDNFKDNGFGNVTKIKNDNGKMKVVTLRNIAESAPYMHNGSLKTLEEVVGHYASGGKYSPNKDPLLLQVALNNVQKKQIVAFLKTLSDSTYLNNPAYKNPFK